MLACVITCSDRASAGAYQDRSGVIVRDGLVALGFDVASPTVVPDDVAAIRQAIVTAVGSGARVVITTGGTGVGPRDVTPEATRALLRYEVPGIMEAIRAAGAAATPLTWLSRGLAGVVASGDTLAVVINAPGSPGGARDTVAVAGPLLMHLISQLDGGDHDRPLS